MNMPSPFLCLRELTHPWYLPLRQSKMSLCIYYQIAQHSPHHITTITIPNYKKLAQNILFEEFDQIWTWLEYNLKMKDNYVSNIEEVLIANQAQKNKIQFLERERVRREHYLEDLQQNLHLNKATLREINDMGPNVAAISRLTEETQTLIQKLRSYYEEYQSINTVLLMQKQMRLEDKHFYNQRMVEFENKMVDLRKYLHDKQDSFSSVVARLKRYEDLIEPTLDEKLINYKKQIGERHVNEFIAQIIKEKNYYQKQYQNMHKNYYLFNEIKTQIVTLYPEVQTLLEQYENIHQDKLQELFKGLHNRMAGQIYEKERKQPKKLKVDPNKELIRLVKKQKLSKDLYEDALNQAIQKNEELVTIKSLYQKKIQTLQLKYALLHAQNTIFALRLAEFDVHYSRYATHCKKYYEEGETKGLRSVTEKRLKQYANTLKNFSILKLNKSFESKLKDQVEKWDQFACESSQLKRQLDKKGILIKSCSAPQLLFGFELDQNEQNEQLLIEQY